MKELPSIEMLAAHLDAALSPDQFAANPPPEPFVKPPSEVADASGADSRLKIIEGVVAEQARTIDRLVNLLEKLGIDRKPATPEDSPAMISKGSRDGGVIPESGPVAVASTAPQRGIYASSRLSNNLSASYNESMNLRLTGAISVQKLTRAMERLVQRHDALRASFDESGALMQIMPAPVVNVPVTDLTTVSNPRAREERLDQLLRQETAKPFPLPGGPLFRTQIVLLGADSAALVFTGHHIICDGWSLDVLIHDLCAFYSEEISGQPARLRPAGSYSEYAQGVSQREHSVEFREARAYWQSKFAEGFQGLVLPADHARPVRREFAARRLDRAVAAPLVQNLRTLGAEQGCSFFSVILSALSILLARVSGQQRFVIVLPTAEQPAVGQPDLVGHCVSLLPFAVDLVEGESVGALLTRVQNELAAAQDHSAYTLISLLEELRPVATLRGVSPISAGLTSVKKFQPQDLPQSGFSADYDANPMSFQSFEWYLNVVEVGNSLELKCHDDTGLFERSTVQAWLEAFDGILRDIVADPSREAAKLAGLNGEGKSSAAEVLYALAAEENIGDSLPLRTSISGQESPHRPVLSSGHRPAQEANLLKAMLDIWRRVLDVRTVEPDDDFFMLGGHSIVAAQLFMLIEQELGRKAPLAALYESSTPRTLTRMLARGDGQEAWQSLIPINRAGNRRPLFLVHAAEGNILLYRNLARHLGPDQPVYGLQAAGLDGKSPIDAQFEHVASRYIDEIRQVQPEGPYMLGGYCLGGTIALEVAQQLISAGETIGLLAMIENFNIKSTAWPLPLHLRLFNHFLNPYYHLLNLLAAEGGGRWKFFREKAGVEFSRATIAARVALSRTLHWLGMPSEYPHIRVRNAFDQALQQYEVKPYPGELTIFMAQRHLAGMGDRLGGWGQVVEGGVRVFTWPLSRRGSLVEPYVQVLAAQLRECLETANDPGLRQTNSRLPKNLLPGSSHVDQEAESAA